MPIVPAVKRPLPTYPGHRDPMWYLSRAVIMTIVVLGILILVGLVAGDRLGVVGLWARDNWPLYLVSVCMLFAAGVSAGIVINKIIKESD